MSAKDDKEPSSNDKPKGMAKNYSVPEWHKEIVAERMKQFKDNPKIATDFDEAMDEIEKELEG